MASVRRGISRKEVERGEKMSLIEMPTHNPFQKRCENIFIQRRNKCFEFVNNNDSTSYPVLKLVCIKKYIIKYQNICRCMYTDIQYRTINYQKLLDCN